MFPSPSKHTQPTRRWRQYAWLVVKGRVRFCTRTKAVSAAASAEASSSVSMRMRFRCVGAAGSSASPPPGLANTFRFGRLGPATRQL